MANDSSKCEAPGTQAVTYAISSTHAANAGFVGGRLYGCHVALVALKHIEEGSEVLVSYGEAYWLSRLTVSSLPPTQRRWTA